jgi:hypothetical protein
MIRPVSVGYGIHGHGMGVKVVARVDKLLGTVGDHLTEKSGISGKNS